MAIVIISVVVLQCSYYDVRCAGITQSKILNFFAAINKHVVSMNLRDTFQNLHGNIFANMKKNFGMSELVMQIPC